MVWVEISVRGTTNLVIINNNVDTVKYSKVLESALIAFICAKYGGHDDGVVFQHDGGPSQNTNFTKMWLISAGVIIMEWSACSQDLNAVENAWGWLGNEMYKGQLQFNNVGYLVEALTIYLGQNSEETGEETSMFSS